MWTVSTRLVLRDKGTAGRYAPGNPVPERRSVICVAAEDTVGDLTRSLVEWKHNLSAGVINPSEKADISV